MHPDSPASSAKPGLHPRNLHAGRYDIPALVRASPALAKFVQRTPTGAETIDFADPAAVTALNRALLQHHYGVTDWSVPPGYLCPPIPGRADYLHHVADLLGGGRATLIPRGPQVRVLDLGVGANCIYPLLGASLYGWRFVGTEIDPVALANARRIVAANPRFTALIECRHQPAPDQLFRGVIAPGETFALCVCNPPFHASAAAAAAGTTRKLRHLHGAARRPLTLNFGGRAHELWCDGGEAAFIRRLAIQSAACPHVCGWFTTLVSRSENLPAIERTLAGVQAAEVRILAMAQGQKRSRIVAWRFA